MKTAELIQSLSDGQVDYVLVGGLAVQLHGFSSATFVKIARGEELNV